MPRGSVSTVCVCVSSCGALQGEFKNCGEERQLDNFLTNEMR